MKPLTIEEISFVKKTRFTPTVFQCDEYSKIDVAPYFISSYTRAQDVARDEFNIDLGKFLSKCLMEDDSDSISLEYVATYLFYCFFTKEELEAITEKEATDFLQNLKYYSGFRHWDHGNLSFVRDAIDIYNGVSVFYLTNDGHVWNIVADSDFIQEHPERIWYQASKEKECNKFEYVSSSKKNFDLPTRATNNSAGYDFHSPECFTLNPGEIKSIKLQVKVKIKPGEVLLLFPRSSLGWKYNVHLVNTVGVIDSDYYNNEFNEGEIGLKLFHQGTQLLKVNVNDRLIQGVFVKYDITEDDSVKTQRKGGFGSTGR